MKYATSKTIRCLLMALLFFFGPADAGNDVTFINDVHVFDGNVSVGVRDVLITGHFITAIDTSLDIPAGAIVIEGQGMTLMPGLIDSHVHTTRRSELQEALLFGVTTELGMLDLPQLLERIRDEHDVIDRADLVSAISMATATGGHGTQYGIPIPTIDSPSNAGAFVDERMRDGASLLKIAVEDHLLFGADEPSPSLTNGTVARLIDAAHDRGLVAVTHVSKVTNGKHVFRMGGDGLAHMPIDRVIDTPFIRAALKNDHFIVPTLVVSLEAEDKPFGRDPLLDPDLQPWITPTAAYMLSGRQPPAFSAGWDVETAYESVRLAHDAGILLIAGTDSGTPGTAHGVSLHRELELLVHSGMSAAAVDDAASRPFQRFVPPAHD